MGQNFGLNLFLLAMSSNAFDLPNAYTSRADMTLEDWHVVRSSAGAEVLKGLDRVLSKASLGNASLVERQTILLLVHWTILIVWHWSPFKYSHNVGANDAISTQIRADYIDIASPISSARAASASALSSFHRSS